MVPTIAEAGVQNYEVSPWFAVFAPAGTPAPVVRRINAALLDAMRHPIPRPALMPSAPSLSVPRRNNSPPIWKRNWRAGASSLQTARFTSD